MTRSIRTRFAFTVGANLVRAVLSLVTGIVLARSLGPRSYGDMAFLSGTFVAVGQLLDMGSSSAFFTFLSQRPRSRRFVGWYAGWLAAQFLVPLLAIWLLFPARWVGTIWHGEERALVLLAFAAVFMQNTAWSIFQQAGESQRRTLFVQGVGVVAAAVQLLAFVLLWWLGALKLPAVFAVIAIEYLLASIVAHTGFSYAAAGDVDAAEGRPSAVFNMYLRYCLPLIPYSWIAFAYVFADRWLLQTYGGGVQQAYYAVGAQYAGVALIAASSILRIFWKEIAEAHHRGDYERMGVLYRRVSRLLFLVGAAISGFFIPWTQELLRMLLGAAYVGGAATLAIMFIYPIHQSTGQITGTMLLATERVSLQVVLGIVFMVASMAVTYVVLAPRDAMVPGLGLASIGLALKMVVMQIISVNAVAFAIARIWKWRMDWVYQPVGLLSCVALGWIAEQVVQRVVGGSLGLPLRLGLAGALYLPLIAGLVYTQPWLVGVTRDELVADVRRAWRGGLRFARVGEIQP